ncbi:MAG: Uma2 family endonuclease [Polyangiales bacterium]
MTASPTIELVRRVPVADDRWLLDEEDMPEAPLHDYTLEALVLLLKAWVARTGRDASVHRNIAMRWTPSRPKIGADPDVCVVSPALPADATSLCLWKPGHTPPSLAIEVVSEGTASKDYLDNPARYAASGTQELWILDPLRVGPSDAGGPFGVQVYQRVASGRFVQVYAGEGPAESALLGAWVHGPRDQIPRITEDEAGERPWRTEAEAQRAQAEADRAAREAAELEIARLREELARLRA